MSVYITNMDIPKDEAVALYIYPDGRVKLWRPQAAVSHEYKAVPVPPHGRLIDTSAKVQTQLYDDEHEEWADVEMTVEEYLGYCHNEVPTILPAEGGE